MRVLSKMLVVILMVACMSSGAPSYASEFRPDNTVIISTAISGATMAPVTQKVIDWAVHGVKGNEVHLIINSPGGSVVSGFVFVSKLKALQAKGVKVNCYVEDFAASMAFQILTQCDKRVVLNESLLLWHRVRVNASGPITAPQAHDLMVDLTAYDDHIISDLLKSLKGVSIDYIMFHFEKETLHTGLNLCKNVPSFCTSVDVVPGMLEALANEKITRTAVTFNIFGESDIMYIWEKFPVMYVK